MALNQKTTESGSEEDFSPADVSESIIKKYRLLPSGGN